MCSYQDYRCLAARLVLLCGSALLLPQGAVAAGLNAYAFLAANGTDIEGQPTVLTLGGDDVSMAIECHSAVYELYTKNSIVSPLATTPVPIRKRVDKSSPLLAKALVQNQRIDGEIRFCYHDDDSGVTARSYTLTITQGRVSAIRSWLPDRSNPDTTNLPQLEEVSLEYSSLTVTDEGSGTTFTFTIP